ncbi:hypothetical protein OGAPHI_001286 [Ogataea philodendri]|uniref:Activator of C kinase protein 1 n=1 Tax=Ogataea philodendri TaxID=1378263 RepID=A0A9P8PFN7_9ASCO|nr:uncharacterized protein OGAPHI_001286 [Ogataea philodendri]KAH3670770.1 hypothetical protein OGAPHI_001286 [Ogataea philodendri]
MSHPYSSRAQIRANLLNDDPYSFNSQSQAQPQTMPRPQQHRQYPRPQQRQYPPQQQQQYYQQPNTFVGHPLQQYNNYSVPQQPQMYQQPIAQYPRQPKANEQHPHLQGPRPQPVAYGDNYNSAPGPSRPFVHQHHQSLPYHPEYVSPRPQPQVRSSSYTGQSNDTQLQNSSNDYQKSIAPTEPLRLGSRPHTSESSAAKERTGNMSVPISSLDNDRINQLEDKIQQLEKMLALQELGSKNNSLTSVSSGGSSVVTKDNLNFVNPVPGTSKLSLPMTPDNKATSQESPTNESVLAPPLPPPPPIERRSIANSPVANAFLASGFENSNTRDSVCSLNSDEKELVGSLQDSPEKRSADLSSDLPPSYEELEKSGSLTYSQSIYRTGFEKAGFHLDHMEIPKRAPKLMNSGGSDQSSPMLKYKRKLPPPASDSVDTILGGQKESILARPSQPKAPQRLESESSVSSSIYSEPQNKAVGSSLSHQTAQRAPVLPKPDTEKTDVLQNTVRFIKPSSFKKHTSGIIEPILPSKSEESVDSLINDFGVIRDKAFKDYKVFTPSIQFEWAIYLLEAVSRSDLISKMAIDGRLRKSPIPLTSLGPQREQFLNTAVKVLEKVIQISPNSTRARVYLGDIYSGGIHPGVLPKNEVKGYKLFYDAATRQNDPVACYRVACCLESGVGCTKSVEESCRFFQKGADLGDPSSMCQLGMLCFAGVNGFALDIKKSVYWHEKACEALKNPEIMGSDPLISARSFSDSRGALYTLAKLHQTDLNILCLDRDTSKTQATLNQMRQAGIFRNVSKTLSYYLEAAKLEHQESQASLGFYYAQGYFPTSHFKSDKDSMGGTPVPSDPRRSIYWFSKAAAENHPYSSLGLAKWYGSGAQGVLKKDEQQAFLWGRKAADEGQLAEAEFMIGLCFEQGFGIPKNFQSAVAYYKRSASKGYKKALSKLKQFKEQNPSSRY